MRHADRLRGLLLGVVGVVGPGCFGSGGDAKDDEASTSGSDGSEGTEGTERTAGTEGPQRPQCFANAIELTEEIFDAQGGDGRWIVCIDRPPDGCLTASGISDNDLQMFLDAAGTYSDTANTIYEVKTVCGPDPTVEDRCCYVLEVTSGSVGRPLLVDEAPRLAPVARGQGWDGVRDETVEPSDAARAALAQAWEASGQGEHASVASFARFALQLLALGAPAELVDGATAAMADEVTHAQVAFALARHFSGQDRGPGPLDLTGVAVVTDLAEVVAEVIREGCVGETLAALSLRVAADRCADPATARSLRTTADDEERHAVLAWRFVRWALAKDPGLAPHIREVFAGITVGEAEGDGPHAVELERFGHLSAATRRALARDGMERVIGPCVVALVG